MATSGVEVESLATSGVEVEPLATSGVEVESFKLYGLYGHFLLVFLTWSSRPHHLQRPLLLRNLLPPSLLPSPVDFLFVGRGGSVIVLRRRFTCLSRSPSTWMCDNTFSRKCFFQHSRHLETYLPLPGRHEFGGNLGNNSEHGNVLLQRLHVNVSARSSTSVSDPESGT